MAKLMMERSIRRAKPLPWTVAEWTLMLLEEEGPISALLGAIQIVKSGLTGDPCTERSCYASASRWCDIYGIPTEWTIKQWLADIPTVAATDVPNSVALMAVGEW